jgi:haloacid dehalogenase-like hydrolase
LTIVFDLDGTICTGRPYEEAKLIPGMRELLCKLRDNDHTIIINTARGMGSCNNNVEAATELYRDLTIAQLSWWKIPYDEIYFGKPAGDAYVDDKAIAAGDVGAISATLSRLEKTCLTYKVAEESFALQSKDILGKIDMILGG